MPICAMGELGIAVGNGAVSERYAQRFERIGLAAGAGIGVACYAGLLTFHLLKFGRVEYRVPNVKVIIHVDGRYGFVGYGRTWELTALNGPAEAVYYLSHPLKQHRRPSGKAREPRSSHRTWT